MSSVATFYCRDNCADRFLKLGYIRKRNQQGGLAPALLAVFGIAPETLPGAVTDITPSLSTSMDIIVSNFNGLGVRRGYMLILKAHIKGRFI